MRSVLSLVILLAGICVAQQQEPARVFITDSESWEMAGGSGGSGGTFAGGFHGGARPQTAEIIKTFGERCPDVKTNNIQQNTDYIVVLDHEGGKGLLRHKNKVAVFIRTSGDSLISKSTLSLGGSVQEACDAIKAHWTAHATELRAAAAEQKEAAKTVPQSGSPELAKPSGARLSIISNPDAADIEVDGSFVGSTPSSIELQPGDHSIAVKKAGYKDWQRKIKISGGDVKISAELEKSEAPK